MANPFDQFDNNVANPFDEFSPPETPTTPVAVDVAGQLATGIVKGIPNMLDLGGAAVATAYDAATGQTPQTSALQNFQQYLQSAPVSRGVDTVLGTTGDRQAETAAGRYANMVGQGIATAPLVGAKFAQGAAGGLMGGVGGDIGKASGVPYGEIAGALVGGAAGAAAVGPLTQRAKALTQRLAAPKIDQNTAQLAQRAQDFGILLSVNQINPTRFGNTVQKVSQEIPFSGVGAFDDAQSLSWNKALAREAVGMDVDALTPKAVRGFLDKVDQDYTDALAGTTVRITKDQLSRFDDIAQRTDVLPDAFKKPVFDKIKYIKNQIANGFVKGEKANNLRKELMAASGRAGPELKDYFAEMAATLGDTIVSSLPAEKAALLAQTNRYYRNFKTVEPLLEKSVDGIVNPTQLQQRIASSKYIRGSRLDSGDDALIDLGRIGAMIPKLGGSDTAQKTMLMQAAGAVGATGGAAIDPASTAAVLGANRAYQSLYNQNPNIIKAAIKKSGAETEGAARRAAFEAAKSQRGAIDPKTGLAIGTTAALGAGLTYQAQKTAKNIQDEREAEKKAFEASKQKGTK